MALLRYFKPVAQTVDGLPDPRGPLSAQIPSSAIAEANRAIRNTISEGKKIRGKYKIYMPAVRLEIAKYACNHGVTSAARVFSRRLRNTVAESTVRSMRDAYRDELRKRSAEDVEEMSVLPSKKTRKACFTGRRARQDSTAVLKEDQARWRSGVHTIRGSSSTCHCAYDESFSIDRIWRPNYFEQELGAFFVEEDEVRSEKIDNIKKQVYR